MWKALGIVFGWTMTVLVWAIPPYGVWAALYGTVTDVPTSAVPVMRVLLFVVSVMLAVILWRIGPTFIAQMGMDVMSGDDKPTDGRPR